MQVLRVHRHMSVLEIIFLACKDVCQTFTLKGHTQNRESFTGMQSLSFYNGVLPCNIFEINSGMLTSF